MILRNTKRDKYCKTENYSPVIKFREFLDFYTITKSNIRE